MNRPNLSNKTFFLIGLTTSLGIAAIVSSFASSDPDGLDRIAQDFKFENKADEEPLAHRLPFYSIFEEYSLRGVPEKLSTPLAGIIGTLTTFGLAWGLGKVVTRRNNHHS